MRALHRHKETATVDYNRIVSEAPSCISVSVSCHHRFPFCVCRTTYVVMPYFPHTLKSVALLAAGTSDSWCHGGRLAMLRVTDVQQKRSRGRMRSHAQSYKPCLCANDPFFMRALRLGHAGGVGSRVHPSVVYRSGSPAGPRVDNDLRTTH